MSQVLDIPLQQGLDLGTDERLAGGLLAAYNVRQKRRGAWAPMPGNERLVQQTAAVIAQEAAEAAELGIKVVDTLGELGSRLFAVGDGRCLTYIDSEDQWSFVGRVPQMVLQRDAIGASAVGQYNPSIAANDDLLVICWEQQISLAPITYATFISTYDRTTGACLVSSLRVLTTTVTIAGSMRPKIVWSAADGVFYIAMLDNITLTFRTYTGGVTTAPCGSFPDADVGGFDIAPLVAGNLAILYTDLFGGTYNTWLRVISPLSVLIGSHTVNSGADLVSTHMLHVTADARTWWAIGTLRVTGPVNSVRVLAGIDTLAVPSAPAAVLASTLVYTRTPVAGFPESRQLSAVEIDTSTMLLVMSFQENGAPSSDGPEAFTVPIKVSSAGAVTQCRQYYPGVMATTQVWTELFSDRTHYYFAGIFSYEISQPTVGSIPALCPGVVVEVLLDPYTLVPATPSPLAQCIQAHYAVGQMEAFAAATVLPTLRPSVHYFSHVSAVVRDFDGHSSWVGRDLQVADAPGPLHIVRARTRFQRQAAYLGGLACISGGVPICYDGQDVCEWGFMHAPFITGVPTAGANVWRYKANYERVVANGAVMRGPVSAESTVTAATTPVTLSIYQLTVSQHPMIGPIDQSSYAYAVYYRTINGSAEPFYRGFDPVSGLTGATAAGTKFLTKSDTFTDAALDDQTTLYTFGNVLDATCPPTSEFVTCWKDVLVLAGTDDDSIWHSIPYTAGEVPYFNEALRIQPFEGGRITGISSMDDKLVIFKESSIFLITGRVPNRQGAGSTLSDPIKVSTDVGCIAANTIEEMPVGLLFRGAKGVYLLGRDLQVSFVGLPVEPVTEDVSAEMREALMVPAQNLVRFPIQNEGNGQGDVLIFDYLTGAWSRRRISSLTEPLLPWAQQLHEGRVHWADSGGDLFRETDTFADIGESGFVYSIRTPFVKPTGLQGYFKALRVSVLGEYGAAHTLTVRFFKDYDSSSVFQTATFTVTTAPAAGYQFIVPMKGTQRVESLAVELEVDGGTDQDSPPAILSGISLEWEPFGTQQRRVPSGQKG